MIENKTMEAFSNRTDSAERPTLFKIESVVPEKVKHRFIVNTEGNRAFCLNRVTSSPKYLIVYRENPITCVSTNYTLVTHDEVRNAVMEVMEARKMNPKTRFCNPRPWQFRMFCITQSNVELPTLSAREILGPNKELWDVGFMVSNSYDTSLGLNVELFGERLVCSNGLIVSRLLDRRIIKHISSKSSVDDILKRLKENVVLTLENMNVFTETVAEFSKTPATREQALAVGRSLNVRKYEAEIMKNAGLDFKFDRNDSKPADVILSSSKIVMEIDLLNAFTWMAGQVTTTARKIDIQSKIAREIIKNR